MQRMITNKILWFNIIAATSIEIAMVNYFYHEENYLQSRFFLPAKSVRGISNEWTSRIFTNMLKPSIVALIILVAGLIISKSKITARYTYIIHCHALINYFFKYFNDLIQLEN